MLTFYCHPVSTNARRVWVALLEKQIPFQPVIVDFESDNLAEINPFQRIPAIVDDGFRVIESIAILDYLESQYPTPALMPSDPKEIAIARMVQMVSVNELQPAILTLLHPLVGLPNNSQKQKAAEERITVTFQFYERLLGSHSYFIGERISLADIVAGTLVPSLSSMGFSLKSYPHLAAWVERLAARESWQKTTPDSDIVEATLPSIKKILERRSQGI